MPRQLLAVVIEPSNALAQTVAEVLGQHGFETLTASTHAGGARQVEAIPRVDFLAGAVPAPGEDHVGAYLEEARTRNSAMGVLVMLSDPNESADDAPRGAVRIIKPFSRDELAAAIDLAMQLSHRP